MLKSRLLILLLFPYLFGTANNRIDSLQTVWANSSNDTTYITNCIGVGWEYMEMGVLDSSERYFNIALEFSNEKEIINAAFIAKNALAALCIQKGELQEAKERYNKMLAEPDVLPQNLISLYANLGLVDRYLGFPKKSIESFEKALTLLADSENDYQRAMLYSNIAYAHSTSENYTLALEYDTLALNLKKNLNNPISLGLGYSNVARDYVSLKKYNKGLGLYRKSLEMAVIYDSGIDVALAQYNIGSTYLSMYEDNENNESEKGQLNIEIKTINYLDSAFINKKKAYEFFKNSGNNVYLNEVKNGLIRIMVLKEQFQEAIPLYLETYESSIGVNAEAQYQATEGLYKCYKGVNDYENALLWYERMNDYSDSLRLADKDQKIFEITEKYGNDVQQNEIELQEAKLDSQNQHILAQEDRQFYFIIIFIIVLLIGVYLLYNNKRLKRISKELLELSIVASKIENPIVISSLLGVIEYVNKSYDSVYNVKQNIIGKQLKDVSIEADIAYYLSTTIQTKKTSQYISLVADKWIQTTVNPVLDEENEVSKIVLVDSDITPLKQIERKLSKRSIEINDSIKSAKNIQNSLLPSSPIFSEFAAEHFTFFKPKDLVSGDFYFCIKKDGYYFFAVADCTGHGVPGALMSILSILSLEKSIARIASNNTGEILNLLSEEIEQKLNENIISENAQKEGVDITLCRYNPKNLELQFSGAYNPLYLVRDRKLEEYKTDKIHIGYHKKEEQSFKTYTIQIKPNDIIYLSSDGFPDQKGGVDGKKFYYAPFRSLLQENSTMPLIHQKIRLSETFDSWKAEKEQIDDVLIMGVKF